MDAVLDAPSGATNVIVAPPETDPILTGPATAAVATPVIKKVRSGAGYCSRCKSFISAKREHTAAECDANIAKRAAGRHSPKTRRKIRMTPRRIQNMRKLAKLAAIGEILSGKVERLKRMANSKSMRKNKRTARAICNSVSIPEKSLNKKIRTLSRSVGL